MKVRVYFNLHKKVWSVQDYQAGRGWRIVAHAREVHLRGVTFSVSEAGRLRVIREKRKNVHAYAVGELVYTINATRPDGQPWDEYAARGPFPNEHHVKDGLPCWLPVRYNPYEGPNFTMGGEPVATVPQALFMGNRKLFGLTTKGSEVY